MTGVRGIIQLALLKELERKTGKPVYELFDLIIGTSVGSIIGGVLATGKVTASELFDMFYKEVDNVFKKNFFRIINFFGNGKYDRKPLVKILKKTIGTDTKMNECKTDFICTAVCVNDGRNHFFKSWEDKDGELNLIKVINRSYAAPYYFNPVDDDATKTTWLDGGVGNSNCSLQQALIEVYRRDWPRAFNVAILSLGTGYHKYKVSYKKSKRWRNIRSAMFYLNPAEGGRARNQMVNSNIAMAQATDKYWETIEFQRIDTQIKKKMDKLDSVKYKDKYVEIGEVLAKTINYAKLGIIYE